MPLQIKHPIYFPGLGRTHAQFRPMRDSTLMLYGEAMYPEGFSFFELTCFALSLDWKDGHTTRNCDRRKSMGKMGNWFGGQAERMKGEKLVGSSCEMQADRLLRTLSVCIALEVDPV